MSDTLVAYMESYREDIAPFFADAEQCLMIFRDALLDDRRLAGGLLAMVDSDYNQFYSELEAMDRDQQIASIEMLLAIGRVGLAHILETARDGHSPGPGMHGSAGSEQSQGE